MISTNIKHTINQYQSIFNTIYSIITILIQEIFPILINTLYISKDTITINGYIVTQYKTTSIIKNNKNILHDITKFINILDIDISFQNTHQQQLITNIDLDIPILFSFNLRTIEKKKQKLNELITYLKLLDLYKEIFYII